MSEQVPGYVWNCYIKSREGDGPLFVAHDDTVTARLDGYAVIPMEEHNAALARIARLEAALRPFAEWSSGLPSKTSAAVKMYAACVNAVAALADALGEET